METLFGPDPGGGEDPLAVRARPASLEDFVGQSHLLEPGSALRAAVEQGLPHSMILTGPPGVGKTTLARMLGAASGWPFEELSAVQAGRAEVREVIERARLRRASGGAPTVLFLDEIHRFNKAQQDALLPAVEEGSVVLIGATTENPAFEVNAALLSRSRVYALRALSGDELRTILDRLDLKPSAEPEALALVADSAQGDARAAIAALELAAAAAAANGEASIGVERAADALQRRATLYDRAGDRHYDYISAYIKSVRGSDVDAALYYLAVMLEGGEDPRFIARRIVILASEDVGNARPGAISVAVAAAHAVDRIGMPEAHYPLAQATVYLALAPKSDAAGRALWAARAHVRRHGALEPPSELRSGPRPGTDRGEYISPHTLPGAVGGSAVRPEGLDATFFEAGSNEPELAARMAELARALGRPAA